jgi:hypothetical protein
MAKKMSDAEIRELESKAPTTKTTMGEGKLGSTDYFGFAPKEFYEAGKKAVEPSIIKKAKGGKVRGGGCETKGKTKGRFV